MNISEFTNEQKQIYNTIHELKKELKNCFNPDIFILNPRVSEIQTAIAKLQNNCSHRWNGGVCEVCGRIKD